MLKKLATIFCLIIFPLAAKAQNTWHVASDNNEICKYVLDLENSGKLQNHLLKSDIIVWNGYDGERLISLNLAQQNNLIFFKRFDLNGDGKNEVVILGSSGDADLFYLFDVDFAGQIPILRYPQDNWESMNLSQSQAVGFLQYGEKFYKVGLSKINQAISGLNYLSAIDANNTERVLCQFRQTNEYREELVKSADNPVCEAAKNDRLKYYKVDVENNVAYKNIVEYGETTRQEFRFQGSSPRKYSVQADIDNDGKKDDILLLDVGYPDNRICKYTLPLKFDSKDGAIRGNFTNLLINQISDLCGGVEPSIFEYEGEVYLQMKFAKDHPFNYHKIMKIKDNKMEKICDFDVQVIYSLI